MSAAQSEFESSPLSRRYGFLPTRGELLLALLLIIATLAVYAQVWRFDFVRCWDDAIYVTDNLGVSSGLTWTGIRWAFNTVHGSNWCPLTWLSLMADASLYKNWAGGYHLTNVVLHTLNVLLVFFFFSRTTGHIGPSVFVAALLGIHPLHVESVAWIAERKDVLSMLCGLLAMCAYARFALTRKKTQFAVSLAFFVLSLLAKPTFVTLPFVLLLLDYWPLGRLSRVVKDQHEEAGRPTPSRWRLVAEKLPFVAISVAACIVTMMAQSSDHTVRLAGDFSLKSRIANAVIAYALYLKKAVWPVDLAPFYPHPGSAIDLRDVATACAVLAAFTLITVAVAKRKPFVLVGWLWFLVAMVPMIGLVQVGLQQMADRYAYFPMLGIYAAITWLVPSLFPKRVARELVLPIFSSAIVVGLAGITYLQVGYWRDSLTLMRHNVAVTRENAFGTRLLADAILLEGRYHESIALYQRAIELAPADPQYPARLGSVYRLLGQNEASVEQLRIAISLDDGAANLHVALASAYIAQGRYAEAKQELARAIELDDKNATVYVHLASLCRLIRDYPRSYAYCQRALQLDESLTICHRIIAMNLRDEGRVDAAIQWLQGAEATSLVDDETRQLLAEMTGQRTNRAVVGN